MELFNDYKSNIEKFKVAYIEQLNKDESKEYRSVKSHYTNHDEIPVSDIIWAVDPL